MASCTVRLILVSVLFLTLPPISPCFSREVSFSQAHLGYDNSGNPLPAQLIDPAKLAGMENHDYELAGGKLLRIATNIASPEERGLPDVVKTIRACVEFIEEATGIAVEENILLYLVELEIVPKYFQFEASFSGSDASWGEVRLVLVPSGLPLAGDGSPRALSNLLLDTLPHELGHDVLGKIPSLPHDTDGRPSVHTRWFIEGVCEVLAKGFAAARAPDLAGKFLRDRNVGSVLSDPFIRNGLFSWAQENDNDPGLESDLYGAAFLVLLRWTESVPLKELLRVIGQWDRGWEGAELRGLLAETTESHAENILDQASLLGRQLSERRGDVLAGLRGHGTEGRKQGRL